MDDFVDMHLFSGFLGHGKVWEYTIPSTWQEKGTKIVGVGNATFGVDSFRSWVEVFLQTEGGITACMKKAMALCQKDTVSYFVIERDVIWIIARNMNVWMVREGKTIPLTVLSDHLLSGWLSYQDTYFVSTFSENDSLGGLEFIDILNDYDGGMLCWKPADVAVLSEMLEETPLVEDEKGLHTDIDVLEEALVLKDSLGLRFLKGFIKVLPSKERVWAWEDYMKLQEQGGSGRRFLLWSALGLLLLFVCLGGVGAWSVRVSYSSAEVTRLLDTTRATLQESIDMSRVNPLRSAALLSEAEGLISKLEGHGVSFPQLSELKSQLQSAQKTALGEHEGTPAVWMDLSLIREGFVAGGWAFDAGRIFVLDRATPRILSIDQQTKSADVFISDESLVGGQYIAADNGILWVVTSQAVLKIISTKITSFSITSDMGQVVGLGAFGDNGYLNTTTGIFRISGDEALIAKQWVKDESLSTWLPKPGMSVDGSIWLARDGEIEKWTSGEKESFVVQGLLEPFSAIRLLFTDSDLGELDVVDGTRVVRIDTESRTYIGQYHWDGLTDVTGIFTDSERSYMLLLAGGVIYEVRL